MAARLDQLRAQRELAGLSISQLASLSTTSDTIVNRLEALNLRSSTGGECTIAEADAICAALGISRATAGFVDLG